MNEIPKILAFSGSTRKDSYNKKLLKIAIQGARTAGAEVTYLDLRDFPLPLFDQDLESQEGLPDIAKKFKKILQAHQGFLIASPEYNSSISGVLKNAIDWASRAEPNETPLVCFAGKTAALMSASPGGLGGLRGLVTVRSILGNIGVIVLPGQVSVRNAHEAFNTNGSLLDAKQQNSVEKLGADLASFLKKMHAGKAAP